MEGGLALQQSPYKLFVTSFDIFNESSSIIYRNAQYLDTTQLAVSNTLGA